MLRWSVTCNRTGSQRVPSYEKKTWKKTCALIRNHFDPIFPAVSSRQYISSSLRMVSVGQTPPDFKLKSQSGKDVTLSSFKNKKNVVVRTPRK